MELLKFYFLVLLLVACVVAHSSDAVNKLKPGQKNKSKSNEDSKPVLNRSRRQFGGFGGSFSNANANAGSFSNGGGFSPYGFPYGGGFSGSNSFASANAGSSSFGGR